MGFLGQLFSAQNQFQNKAPQVDYTSMQPGAIAQPQNTINQQGQLAQALQQEMQGGGPNLGATQLQQATDRANSQAAGLIGSQRGMSPALAARQILNQQAANNQGATNQAVQTQQQLQLGAQGQLGNVLGQEGQLGLGQEQALQQASQGQNALNLQAQLANQKAANDFLPSVLGGASGVAQGAAKIGAMFNEGGQVDAMVSPGEMVVPPGGNYDDGGIIPGEAQVMGDSPKNDTVPAKLPVGAVVVPRSVTGGGGPNLNPAKVADFINALKGNQNQTSGYGKVLAAKQRMQRAQ